MGIVSRKKRQGKTKTRTKIGQQGYSRILLLSNYVLGKGEAAAENQVVCAHECTDTQVCACTHTCFCTAHTHFITCIDFLFLA